VVVQVLPFMIHQRHLYRDKPPIVHLCQIPRITIIMAASSHKLLLLKSPEYKGGVEHTANDLLMIIQWPYYLLFDVFPYINDFLIVSDCQLGGRITHTSLIQHLQRRQVKKMIKLYILKYQP
jgi:hypothetical protein